MDSRGERVLQNLNLLSAAELQAVAKDDRLAFICECERPECSGWVRLTLDEARALREHRSRFAVIPGHESPAGERPLERNDRYVVVERATVAPPARAVTG
jgi:hypothetical protein